MPKPLAAAPLPIFRLAPSNGVHSVIHLVRRGEPTQTYFEDGESVISATTRGIDKRGFFTVKDNGTVLLIRRYRY